MGTPKTDPDYEHSEAALREKDGRSLTDRMARWLDGATDDTSAELMREAIDEINSLSMALHLADSATQVAVATERHRLSKDALRLARAETEAERKRLAQVVRDFPNWLGAQGKRELLTAMGFEA